MYPYTPFTSEDISTAVSSVTDLSPFADFTSGLPSGRQVIFFSIGFVCLIASIALVSRVLIADSSVPDLVKALAPIV